VRLFVATFASGENQVFYGEYVRDLVARTEGALKVIPKHSVHLTHAFLGELDDRAAADVIDDLQDVAGAWSAISIQFGPPTILYAGREPRLVRADVTTGGTAARELARQLVTTLRRRAWLTMLKDPHHPHVTLARFRRDARRADAERVAAVLANLSPEEWKRDAKIGSLELVKSELGRLGPAYQVIARAALLRRAQAADTDL
jgi:RNA 2',3'-cyclic 3'-phosphodiesterase